MMSLSTETEINGGFDIQSVCKRCAADDHWSKECRNERIFFCWICGRKNTKTTVCCGKSKETSTRIPYPNEPIYFDHKKGLCATVGFGYDLMLAKIDTSSFRSYIGELHANELGTATNITKAEVFVTMQDGSEKCFYEKIRLRMKFGNWLGYMTFLINVDIKGHIVLGLDFLTLTGTKLTTCGISFTLNDSKIFVDKKATLESKPNVKSVATSTSPLPTTHIDRTMAVGHNHQKTSSNTYRFDNQNNLQDSLFPSTPCYPSFNQHYALPVSIDQSFVASEECGQSQRLQQGKTSSPYPAKIRRDPNFKRYMLRPDQWPKEMCKLIRQRQLFHQVDPKNRLNFTHVIDGISYRICLSKTTSNATVRVLGPVQYVSNEENAVTASASLNNSTTSVTNQPLMSCQDPTTQHQLLKKCVDPTFVRYYVEPAAWSEELRNVIDEAKMLLAAGLQKTKRFVRVIGGVSYRIKFFGYSNNAIVRCLGPVTYIPISNDTNSETRASASVTQSTDSNLCIDMDLATDDEELPTANKNKDPSSSSEHSKNLLTPKEPIDGFSNLETEEISSDDEDYTAANNSKSKLSSISSDTEIDEHDLLSKDAQKLPSGDNYAARKRRMSANELEFVSSQSKVLRTTGSHQTSVVNEKKASEKTPSFENETNSAEKDASSEAQDLGSKSFIAQNVSRSAVGLQNEITKVAAERIVERVVAPNDCSKDLTKDTLQSVELVDSPIHKDRDISTETHAQNVLSGLQQSDLIESTFANTDTSNVASKKQAEEEKRNGTKYGGRKIFMKRTGVEKNFELPPSKIAKSSKSTDPAAPVGVSNSNEREHIMAPATLLGKINENNDSECTPVIDETQSNENMAENGHQNNETVLKQLPFINQLETICISDDDNGDQFANANKFIQGKNYVRLLIPPEEYPTEIINHINILKDKRYRRSLKEFNGVWYHIKLKKGSDPLVYIQKFLTPKQEKKNIEKFKIATKLGLNNKINKKEKISVINRKDGNENERMEKEEQQKKKDDTRRLITKNEQPAQLKELIQEIRKNWTGFDKEKRFFRVFNGISYFVELHKGNGEVVYAQEWCKNGRENLQQHEDDNKPSTSKAVQLTQNHQTTNSMKTHRSCNNFLFPETSISISSTEPIQKSKNASNGHEANLKSNQDDMDIEISKLIEQNAERNANISAVISFPSIQQREDVPPHKQTQETLNESCVVHANILDKSYEDDNFLSNENSEVVAACISEKERIEDRKCTIEESALSEEEQLLNLDLLNPLVRKECVQLSALPKELQSKIELRNFNLNKKREIFSELIGDIQYVVCMEESGTKAYAYRAVNDETYTSNLTHVDVESIKSTNREDHANEIIMTKNTNEFNRMTIITLENNGEVFRITLQDPMFWAKWNHLVHKDSLSFGQEPEELRKLIDYYKRCPKRKSISFRHAVNGEFYTIIMDRKNRVRQFRLIFSGTILNISHEENKQVTNVDTEIETKSPEPQQNSDLMTIVTVEYNGEVFHITLEDEDFWLKWSHLVRKEAIPLGKEPQELKYAIHNYKNRAQHKDVSFRLALNGDFYTITIDKNGCVRQNRLIFSCAILNIFSKGCQEVIGNNNEKQNLCETEMVLTNAQNKPPVVDAANNDEETVKSLESSNSTNEKNSHVIPNLLGANYADAESDFFEEINNFFSSAAIRELLDTYPDNQVDAADAVANIITGNATDSITTEEPTSSSKAVVKNISKQNPSANNEENKNLEPKLDDGCNNGAFATEKNSEELTLPKDEVDDIENVQEEFILLKESANEENRTLKVGEHWPSKLESQNFALSPVAMKSPFPTKPLLKIRTPADIAKLEMLPFVAGTSSAQKHLFLSSNQDDNAMQVEEFLDESFPKQNPVNDEGDSNDHSRKLRSQSSLHKQQKFSKIKFNMKSKLE